MAFASAVLMVFLIFAIIFAAILLGMFCTGTVVLIIGLVSKKRMKKSGIQKKNPKILIILGSVLMIIPTAIIIYFVVAIAVSGSSGSEGYKSDDVMYNERVDEFFAAADADDAQAMYNLFAESVKAENSDLMSEIEVFLEEYPHNPDTNERDGASGAVSTSWKDGNKSNTIQSGFVITKDGENYYCHLDYTNIDEINPEEVGIKYVSMKSEKVYCDEEFSFPNESGIYIQLESSETYDTRRIGGYPEIFTEYDRSITEQQVKNFIEKNKSFSKFKEHFGDPNADDTYLVCVYELETVAGEPRYAELFYDLSADEITIVRIVDDVGDYYLKLYDKSDE